MVVFIGATGSESCMGECGCGWVTLYMSLGVLLYVEQALNPLRSNIAYIWHCCCA